MSKFLRVISSAKLRTMPCRATRKSTSRTALLFALLLLSPLSSIRANAAEDPAPAPAPATDTATDTEDSYLQRAKSYREAGNMRREQFELSRALRHWPNSAALRYNYALHLVRRKNLSGALVHTTHSLNQNPDQPVTANLHLLLLDGLQRTTDSVAWVTKLLTSNQARPPLEPWTTGWTERWRQVLQLGHKHAGKTGNASALALIDGALNRSTVDHAKSQGHRN